VILSPAATAAGAGDALVVEKLSKRFGGALALDNVDLTVRRGEVHGLLGSNGSGKSTLIKILAGFHTPEPGGRISLFGQPLSLPVRAEDAKSLGLAFVHQNLALIPTLSVTENFRLTRLSNEPDWRISWAREHAEVAETLERYGLDFNPLAPLASLSPAEQAMLAIVRATEDLGPPAADRGRLLVLDEPTPFLPKIGVEQMFALVRRIVSEGASVIFVSHDIGEVLEITDRATILRDGALIDVLDTRRATVADFVERIVGRAVRPFHVHALSSGGREISARVEGLRSGALGPISFDLAKGETLGLAGLIGSGFDRVCGALYGAERAAAGKLTIDRSSLSLREIDPPTALSKGIVFLPADRLRAAGVGALPVMDNVLLPVLENMRNGFGLDRRRMRRAASELGDAFQVRPNIPDLPLLALSGGNQQKALIGKWLQTSPKLILLDEPTQGVDVGARQQLFAALDAVSLQGAGIIVASTDFEQLAQVCHRVLIFSRGQIVAELTGDNVTKETIAECCYHSMTRIA
jgi:ribose transport system ATP-binding protein